VNRIYTTLALSLLTGALLLPVQAQDRGQSVIHIPESSIERDEDLGLRAHTNHHRRIDDDGGLGPKGGMSPAQMRGFYGLPASGGSGVIAIVDAFHYPTAIADFNTFSSQFGLPTQDPTSPNTVLEVVTLGTPVVNVGWNQEAALDIEWAHAMAPNAKIVLVEAASNNYVDLFAAVTAARALPGVTQVSMSWGSSEFSGETAYDAYFQYSTSTGNPLFFASTGDQGGRTSYPAVSSLVVAVGGTSVATTSTGGFSSETGWSNGGGGPSSYVSKPSWQNGVGNTGATRSTPDVSSNADPNTGVSVYGPTGTNRSGTVTYYGWMVFGGTSVSAPCMAGMVNLNGLTYKTASELDPSLPLDPNDTRTAAFLTTLYAGQGSANFRDILQGKNKRYSCKPGWDFVTGLGSPQGTGF